MAASPDRLDWSPSEHRRIRQQVRELSRADRREFNRSLLHGRAVNDPELALLTAQAAEMGGFRRDRLASWTLVVAAIGMFLVPTYGLVVHHRYVGLVLTVVVVVAGGISLVVLRRRAEQSARANRELLRQQPPPRDAETLG